ncbi:MAG TPA: ferritin-like domain-containing protein, partial [Nitrospira sp.]|nr:ferritin-like domain-containing protein [Nitrospira sp.]
MKAKDGVLELLNQVLRAELTAVHQYLLHASLCKDWGYSRLHEHFSHLANEEVGHSSGLMGHVLYLDGTPDVEHLDAVAHGGDVAALITADLEFEREDAELLRKAIAHCAKVGDFTT